MCVQLGLFMFNILMSHVAQKQFIFQMIPSFHLDIIGQRIFLIETYNNISLDPIPFGLVLIFSVKPDGFLQHIKKLFNIQRFI